MSVYIDVLIILNLYINYFLIRSTALILKRDCSAKRCILAALIGAVGALIILLPELPFPVIALEKIALGAIMIFASFGKQKPPDFLISALFFLIVNFTFAGLMTALWTFSAPFGMFFGNGTVYFNIPLAAIAALTAAAYFTIKLIRFCADKRLRCNKICIVRISSNGCSIPLNGLCDTGNELCDFFTGKPVIICRFEKILPIVPQNILDYFSGKVTEDIRLVPCRTISEETLLPIFKADAVTVDGKSADAFIGVIRNSLGDNVDCIFNPKIISI